MIYLLIVSALVGLYQGPTHDESEAIEFCNQEAIETQGESERVDNAQYVRECVSDYMGVR